MGITRQKMFKPPTPTETLLTVLQLDTPFPQAPPSIAIIYSSKIHELIIFTSTFRLFCHQILTLPFFEAKVDVITLTLRTVLHTESIQGIYLFEIPRLVSQNKKLFGAKNKKNLTNRMSSAFKKSQKAAARPHRERAQPGFRKHLGLLEKKKDYKLRANNFKQKEAKLLQLRKKAEFKNPDEFYMAMVNAKLVDGVHTQNTEGLTAGYS